MKLALYRALPMVLAIALGSATAYAEEFRGRTPGEWLDGMNVAFAELDYDGVFSYYTGIELSTLRVTHVVQDGVQRERLVHLNGEPREIIRHGDEVACILQPGDSMLELASSIPSGPFARAFTRSFDEIGDVYTMAFHGLDRVANREAVRLAVMPQDGDRYGYRLWIDTATGLLLRSELVDGNSARLEIFQFATLDVGGPIDVAVFDLRVGEGSVISHLTLGPHAQPRLEGGEMRWEATWLPAGFAMASWDIRRTPSNLKSINTLMYSDGLAAFSVFIEAMPLAGAGEMVSRYGATVAVTNLIMGPDDERHLVTVVGEVPTETARRVALSVRYASR
ncbi:MAG: nucleoside transporter [Gammaproteobacteria bacterium]|nr:MAG: nucleoside transporter [Gammaproteobacteria bacterium]